MAHVTGCKDKEAASKEQEQGTPHVKLQVLKNEQLPNGFNFDPY